MSPLEISANLRREEPGLADPFIRQIEIVRLMGLNNIFIHSNARIQYPVTSPVAHNAQRQLLTR